MPVDGVWIKDPGNGVRGGGIKCRCDWSQRQASCNWLGLRDCDTRFPGEVQTAHSFPCISSRPGTYRTVASGGSRQGPSVAPGPLCEPLTERGRAAKGRVWLCLFIASCCSGET